MKILYILYIILTMNNLEINKKYIECCMGLKQNMRDISDLSMLVNMMSNEKKEKTYRICIHDIPCKNSLILPVKIDYINKDFFWNYIVCGNIEKCINIYQLTKYYYMPIDMMEIKQLMDYYGSNTNLNNMFKYFCKKLQTTKIHPKTMYSLYLLTHEIGPYWKKKYCSVEMAKELRDYKEYSIEERARFLISSGHKNISIYIKDISHKEVSEKLGIPITLLELLNEKKCVIAGGAALQLGCDWVKKLNTSDVDFFILNTENKKEGNLEQIFAKQLVKSNYTIGKYGKSILSGITKYGIPSIQVIASIAKTADNLVYNFDLHPVSVYYDGKSLRALPETILSWKNRVCDLGKNSKNQSKHISMDILWKLKQNKELSNKFKILFKNDYNKNYAYKIS
jgi:hypothetical protein